MKNINGIVISEIENWLESHGYCSRHTFIVSGVYMYLPSKISKEDCEEFKNKFGGEIFLKGASLNSNGQYSEFEYYCDHKLLAEYRANVREWLINQDFPLDFITFSSDLSLFCNEKLSQSQIHDFEDEFGVKFSSCSVSCNSNQLKYIFN